jgi:hypothetical protein
VIKGVSHGVPQTPRDTQPLEPITVKEFSTTQKCGFEKKLSGRPSPPGTPGKIQRHPRTADLQPDNPDAPEQIIKDRDGPSPPGLIFSTMPRNKSRNFQF